MLGAQRHARPELAGGPDQRLPGALPVRFEQEHLGGAARVAPQRQAGGEDLRVVQHDDVAGPHQAGEIGDEEVADLVALDGEEAARSRGSSGVSATADAGSG